MSRTGLSEEARFELAMAAEARERRNAPRHLVYLAGAVVVVAAIACLVEVRSWSRAGGEARAALAKQGGVATQVQEYLDLKAKAGGSDKERSGFGKMVSTGEMLAQKAGLGTPNKPREPERPEVQGNLVKKSWAYTSVKSPQAGPLMEWVRSMLAEMPGLRVSSIKLMPRTDGWTMNVTFAGLERVGGGT